MLTAAFLALFHIGHQVTRFLPAVICAHTADGGPAISAEA